MFDIGEAIMGTVEAIGYAIDSVQQGLTYTIQENSNFGAHFSRGSSPLPLMMAAAPRQMTCSSRSARRSTLICRPP
jgi:hypothetical protein